MSEEPTRSSDTIQVKAASVEVVGAAIQSQTEALGTFPGETGSFLEEGLHPQDGCAPVVLEAVGTHQPQGRVVNVVSQI